jgi:hypothetical protein
MGHLSTAADFDFTEFSSHKVNYLRNIADRSMVVDGSVTPVEFGYSPPNGFDLLAVRLSGHIIDNFQMQADDFGGISGPLTNGVRIFLKGPDGAESNDLLDGTELQRNGDFDTFFSTTALLSSRGMGFNWQFALLPIRLRDTFEFVVSIEDDLTSLIHFEMALHGIIIPTSKG